MGNHDVMTKEQKEADDLFWLSANRSKNIPQPEGLNPEDFRTNHTDVDPRDTETYIDQYISHMTDNYIKSTMANV